MVSGCLQLLGEIGCKKTKNLVLSALVSQQIMASQESQISPIISSNPSVGSAGLLAIKFSNQPLFGSCQLEIFPSIPPKYWKYLTIPKLNLSCLFFLNEQIFVGFSTIFKYLIHVIIIKAKLHQLNERSDSSLKATGSRSWP